MFHSCVVLITTFIQNRDKVDCDSYCNFSTILFIGIHCLRDDFVELSINVEVIGITMSVYFSHIFVSIRKHLYDPHVLFHLSPQRLVLFTCHCVCLCVQRSWLHNENLLTSLANKNEIVYIIQRNTLI